MAWTEEQKEYAQRVAIAGLIGGLGGGLIGQFASKPATMGKTVLGVAVGAGLIGAGYGLYLRSGGEPGAEFAGIGQWGWRQSLRSRSRMRRHGIRRGFGSVVRYPHMRTTVGRLANASCSGCQTSGYEVERQRTLGKVAAMRGTYEVNPGSCVDF